MNKVIPDNVLKLAKSKYMNYESVTSIASELNIGRPALQYHVSTHWKEERTLMENEIINGFVDSRVSVLNKISKHSAEIMQRSLEALSKRENPPTIAEARSAVVIFESLDKIMRLDKGQATDIIGETKPMTIVELRKQIAHIDPFYNEEIENAETIEITDESDTTDADS